MSLCFEKKKNVGFMREFFEEEEEKNSFQDV